jgi:hypothetical protein
MDIVTKGQGYQTHDFGGKGSEKETSIGAVDFYLVLRFPPLLDSAPAFSHVKLLLTGMTMRWLGGNIWHIFKGRPTDESPVIWCSILHDSVLTSLLSLSFPLVYPPRHLAS